MLIDSQMRYSQMRCLIALTTGIFSAGFLLAAITNIGKDRKLWTVSGIFGAMVMGAMSVLFVLDETREVERLARKVEELQSK